MSEAASQFSTAQAAPQPEFNIMIVDDEENILGALRRLLRPLGYTVQTATSGEQALDMLERQPADLVISDMRMPGMDGATFLGEVALRWPNTVRIILTGYADMETTIAAINKGTVFRYLRKPWEDADISMTIEQALRHVELERDRRRLQALTDRQNKELKEMNADLERRVEERTAEIKQISEMLDIAYGDMRKEFLNIIPLISNLAKRREGLRQMASEQIGEMAEALAHAMHLGENLVQDVRLAGILFDVGKVALPDAVLGKPEESLTHQEWELYKTYPEIGGTLLKTVEPLQGAAAIVQAQQEHFDGSGYPSGLISDRIPQGARILAVVRDYLALQVGMITPQKLSKGQALDYIRKHTFVRYDSMVVSAFEKLLAGKSSARKVSGTADDPSGGSELARNILDNDPSILADANPTKVGHGSSEKPAGSVRSGERELGVEELEDGMVLARDVKNREGKVILFRGFKLSAALIKKLVGYERNIKTRMAIYVREDT